MHPSETNTSRPARWRFCGYTSAGEFWPSSHCTCGCSEASWLCGMSTITPHESANAPKMPVKSGTRFCISVALPRGGEQRRFTSGLADAQPHEHEVEREDDLRDA